MVGNTPETGARNAAGEARQRRADAERDGVDARWIDAERRRHVGVLHGPARDQSQLRQAQHGEHAAERQDRHADDEQRVGAGAVGADLETAERRRKTDRRIAENRGGEADQEQAQTPGRQHRVDHPTVEEADNDPLDHDPDQPDHHGRHDQHGDPDVHAMARRHDRGIAAEHEKFAMREIDHPHHAENDREPDADQAQAGDRVEDLDRQERSEIHVQPFPSTPDGRTRLRT